MTLWVKLRFRVNRSLKKSYSGFWSPIFLENNLKAKLTPGCAAFPVNGPYRVQAVLMMLSLLVFSCKFLYSYYFHQNSVSHFFCNHETFLRLLFLSLS